MKIATHWNLVAAGPSRAHLTKAHLLDGPIVTVNRALDIMQQGIHPDFAAFTDGPSGAWPFVKDFWMPPTVIWCVPRPVQQVVTPKNGEKEIKVPLVSLARVWDAALPPAAGMRFMPFGAVPDVDNPTGAPRHAFTTLCAFQGILRYQPRVIRILSMDLKGGWHDGMTEEESDKRDKEKMGLSRWRHERSAMNFVITQARAAGVRVEEVIPEPAEQESLDGAVVH